MTTNIFNFMQLRNDLTNEIVQIKSKSHTDELTWEEMKNIVEKLLVEREIMMKEFDELKNSQMKFIPQIYRERKGLHLLIHEINEMVFNDFLNLAYKVKVSPGELLSSLMQDVLDNYNIDGNFPSFSIKNLENFILKQNFKMNVSHQESVKINQADLLELGIKVMFNHIDTLEFASDVDLKTFIDLVESITHCNIVKVPISIPKLILWSKCHYCNFVQFYDEGNPKLILQYVKEANNVVNNWKKKAES